MPVFVAKYIVHDELVDNLKLNVCDALHKK